MIGLSSNDNRSIAFDISTRVRWINDTIDTIDKVDKVRDSLSTSGKIFPRTAVPH